MADSFRRYTTPFFQSGPTDADPAGYFTTDIITEEEFLLLACREYNCDTENAARAIWDERYGAELIESEPGEAVEITIRSHMHADYESQLVARAKHATLVATVFHLRRHRLYLDTFDAHPVDNLCFALAMQFSEHPEVSGVCAVDVLWLERIECDDPKRRRNHIAELLIHLRDDFVPDGIVGVDKNLVAFLPRFEHIADQETGSEFLYYGDFLEVQKINHIRLERVFG